jgi:hypothetical protein
MAETKTKGAQNHNIDSNERLMNVVRNLYKCGSDNRQQKNGSHEKLYSGILSSGHKVRTCGLDGMLPRYLKYFLDTKTFPNEVDYKNKTTFDGIREIAIIIDKLYKINSPDVYIFMDDIGKQVLRRIIDGEDLKLAEYRKSFNLFGKYGVITQQEKSKNRPGKQKYK